MKILIVMGGFFPGKNFGGPPVSVNNFCSLMEEYDCYIVTRNHDMGSKEIYSDINNGWNERINCKVLYLDDKEYRYKKFKEVIEEINPNIIYLQGLFQSCIIPCLILAKRYKIPLILAPRGELCEGAMKKKYKKIPYIIFLRIFRLLDNISFQSTSKDETDAIRRWLKVRTDRIDLLTNIPSIPLYDKSKTYKKQREANFIFLSRIVSKKNLLAVIEYMFHVSGNVRLDIYGTIEDKEYWNECKKKINMLPDNINVEYKGIVNHDQVHDTFKKYDAFIFPTFSENFGHVIVEALMVGCPVIISDQTPWSDVANVDGGWSIPIEKEEKYIQAIQEIIYADKEKEDTYKDNIRTYVHKKINISDIKKEYDNLFQKLIMEKV